MSNLFSSLIVAVLCVMGVLVMIALFKVIKGPGLANRLVSINMIGSMVNVIIILLTIYLDEEWLADVCVLYTLISFLSVIVLSKVYVGVYKEKKSDGEAEK